MPNCGISYFAYSLFAQDVNDLIRKLIHVEVTKYYVSCVPLAKTVRDQVGEHQDCLREMLVIPGRSTLLLTKPRWNISTESRKFKRIRCSCEYAFLLFKMSIYAMLAEFELHGPD